MENLSCSDSPVDERYSFYEHIENYLQYKKFCISNNHCDQYNDKCIFHELGFDDKGVELNLICKRFHYLFDKLITTSIDPPDNNENAHWEYLNYWLNHELNLIQTHLDSKTLFQNIRSKDIHNRKLTKSNGKIKDIPKDEIKHMNSLFYLYDDYINIIKATTKDHASESDFKTYTKHCVKKYQELEDKCLKESTSFCKALCDFKKKYESIILSDEIIKDWSERTLPSLSKHENAQVKSPQLSSTLAHPSLADNGISERANRNLLTSSESLERGSEGPVKPGIMTEKMNVTELIVNDGSRSPKEISYIPYNSRQDSSENNEKIEIPKDNDFDIPTNKIIGTSISTVGVSSLFFLFYKFTSLGSRFRSQNKSKKYIRNNFDQQTNNFLDTSEYQYTPEESMSYNISYNSV